jgi:hypothetical protein
MITIFNKNYPGLIVDGGCHSNTRMIVAGGCWNKDYSAAAVLTGR